MQASDVMLAERTAGESDGRRRRTLRTHAALVDATIRLFRTGATTPTANAVAHEAGVSARSLFAHFADVPLLYQAAIRRVLDALLAHDMPEARTVDLGERIDRFVVHHAQVCEDWLPFQRAAAALRYEHPELWRGCVVARERLRARLGMVFASELVGLDEDEAATLVESWATYLDWDSWSLLRADRGLSVERARATWTLGLSRLMAASQPQTRVAEFPRLVAFN